MANKRNLKKQIKYVCGDLAAECIMAREFIEGIDCEKMNQVVFEIASLQENSIKNCTFSFDKTPRDFESQDLYNKAASEYYHKAYKAFYNEFNKHVAQIVKSMNLLLPKSQREINKQIANA